MNDEVTPTAERREVIRRLNALAVKVDAIRRDRRVPRLHDTYEARIRLVALQAKVQTMQRNVS